MSSKHHIPRRKRPNLSSSLSFSARSLLEHARHALKAAVADDYKCATQPKVVKTLPLPPSYSFALKGTMSMLILFANPYPC